MLSNRPKRDNSGDLVCAIVSLLASTGLRAGDLASLRWRDVDLAADHGRDR